MMVAIRARVIAGFDCPDHDRDSIHAFIATSDRVVGAFDCKSFTNDVSK